MKVYLNPEGNCEYKGISKIKGCVDLKTLDGTGIILAVKADSHRIRWNGQEPKEVSDLIKQNKGSI